MPKVQGAGFPLHPETPKKPQDPGTQQTPPPPPPPAESRVTRAPSWVISTLLSIEPHAGHDLEAFRAGLDLNPFLTDQERNPLALKEVPRARSRRR